MCCVALRVADSQLCAAAAQQCDVRELDALYVDAAGPVCDGGHQAEQLRMLWSLTQRLAELGRVLVLTELERTKASDAVDAQGSSVQNLNTRWRIKTCLAEAYRKEI
jgi:hypothetical protein